MELLTAAEIAKRLDLPESTVRYYRDRFEEYIPTAGEGRGRRYRGEALEVFRFIAENLRSGTPADVLEAEMRGRFAREAATAGPQPDGSSNTAAMVPASALLETMARVGKVLESVSHLPRVVEEQNRELAALRRQVELLSTAATAAAEQQQASEARDRELLSTVAELGKVLEPEPRPAPWWRRLLGMEPA